MQRYYPLVFRWVLAWVGWPEEARRQTTSLCAEVLRRRLAWESDEGPLLVYALVWRRLRRVRRRSIGAVGTPQSPLEHSLVAWLKRLNGEEYALFLLRYLLECPVEQAAQVLGVSTTAAQAQLTLFRRGLAALPADGEEEDAAHAQALSPSGAERYSPAESRAVRLLRRWFPAPSLPEEDWAALVAQVQATPALSYEATQPSWRARLWNWRALWLGAILGMAVLVAVSLLFVGLARFTFRGLPSDLDDARPLRLWARTEDIRRRWGETYPAWRNLFVEVQSVDYGPAHYLGPPFTWREQAWVALPDQAVYFIDSAESGQGQVTVSGGGRVVQRNALAVLTRAQVWDGTASGLLPPGPLRTMLFPATSPWMNAPGRLRPAGVGRIAGHSTLIFDWLTPQGERTDRLWLETRSGIILRWETYLGASQDSLRHVSQVTRLTFEQAQPPSNLALAARMPGQGEGDAPESEAAPLWPARRPTPAVTPLAKRPAPPGMDLSYSVLTFQFAAPLEATSALQTADLFADGYWLGRVRIGLPWGLRCQRSPDGRRLAYVAASQGLLPGDDALRWFNLNEPSKLYTLLPEVRVTAFAFAPDGLRLAAAGEGRVPAEDGLYTVNLVNGESTLLRRLYEGRSLVWSPEGEFLALIARLAGEESPSVLVIHVRTRRVVEQWPLSGGEVKLPPDSLIHSWERPFPNELGGLEACATPP